MLTTVLGRGKRRSRQASLQHFRRRNHRKYRLMYPITFQSTPVPKSTWKPLAGRGLENMPKEEACAVTGDCCEDCLKSHRFFFSNKLIVQNPCSALLVWTHVDALTSRCSTKQSKRATRPRKPMTGISAGAHLMKGHSAAAEIRRSRKVQEISPQAGSISSPRFSSTR